MGMGDIVYWKDGREVYDSVNVTYRYSDGTKIAYESLISNKFNGMEDQILGHKGTMEMAKGIYYLEEDHSTSGIRQLTKFLPPSQRQAPAGDRKRKWNTLHISSLTEIFTLTAD